MKLREKTLLIVIVTIISLLVIIYSAVFFALFSGFAKVEHDYTVKNIQRMIDAFSEKANNLSVKIFDWSKWDDTYTFIADKNKAYIESNLQDQSIGDLNLNYMFFINTAGKFVFCRGFDLETDSGFDPTPALKSFILADSLLVYHKNTESAVAGIVMSPEGPLTVASRPITTSQGGGPIRGSVIFARHIDSNEIAHIAQLTHLSLCVLPCSEKNMPPDMQTASGEITPTTPMIARPLNADTIAGYCRIADIHLNNALNARIDLPRDIYKQGIRTGWYLFYSILTAGIIFGVVILVLLEKSVISRVAKLSADVKAITASGDHSHRVTLKGHDELAALGTTINTMLEALEHGEKMIVEHNRKLRMIMNNVPIGLLSLDEQYRVNPEYSRSAGMILGSENLEGRNFLDLLGLTGKHGCGGDSDHEKLAEFLDVFCKELLPEAELGPLNPFEELQIKNTPDGNTKWISINYYLIKRGSGNPNHVLVVLKDISTEKALGEKIRQAEQENIQLKAIVEDPDLFNEFLCETRAIIKHAEEKMAGFKDNGNHRLIVNEVFRDIHTIKGTASAFGLFAVSAIAGQIEESLGPLRDKDTLPSETLPRTAESLVLLTKTVMDAVESTRSILGDDTTTAQDPIGFDIQLKISLAKLKRERRSIGEMVARELLSAPMADMLRKKIDERLFSLQQVTARKGFAKVFRIIPGLQNRLQKNIHFRLEGADVSVDCEIARKLTAPLIHMVRNAFDHGIEATSEDRVSRGKPVAGQVTLGVSTSSSALILTLSDDGRGMDPENIKQIALKKGVISPEQAAQAGKEELFALIYKPGFSTAAGITEVSGRGVGMDVVQNTILEKLHGSITIDSKAGKGTTFTVQVPIGNCGL